MQDGRAVVGTALLAVRVHALDDAVRNLLTWSKRKSSGWS
jgi:hypothetical protein